MPRDKLHNCQQCDGDGYDLGGTCLHCRGATSCPDWTCCPPPGYTPQSRSTRTATTTRPASIPSHAPSSSSSSGDGGFWAFVILIGSVIAIMPFWILFGYPYLVVRAVIDFNPFLVALAFLGFAVGAVALLWNRYVYARALGGVLALCAFLTLFAPLSRPVLPSGTGFGDGAAGLLLSVGAAAWLGGLFWYTRRRKRRNASYDPNAPRRWTPWGALDSRSAAPLQGVAARSTTRTATLPAASSVAPVRDHLAPAWHPDPTRRHTHRYWDGTSWTRYAADDGNPADDPIG